jgi:Phage integrase family
LRPLAVSPDLLQGPKRAVEAWASLQHSRSCRFAPHQLRHAHAVEMAREGVPLVVIQRQLGHSNLGITSKASTTPKSSIPSTPAGADDPGQHVTPALTDSSRGAARRATGAGRCLGTATCTPYSARVMRFAILWDLHAADPFLRVPGVRSTHSPHEAAKSIR